MSNTQQLPDELPKWLWLIAAPAILPLIILTRYLDPEFFELWIEPEGGLIEVVTPVILLVATISGILIARRHALLPAKWVAAWFALHAMGSFYFAGEDLSWGQHFFGWRTPPSIVALNDQGETNLHNMSSWFDQKPRVLLVLWSILGGAGAPLLAAWGKLAYGGPRDWRYWIFPRRACVIPGLVVALVWVPEEFLRAITRWAPFLFDFRISEVQELHLAIFLSFYMVSVYRRTARHMVAGNPGG